MAAKSISDLVPYIQPVLTFGSTTAEYTVIYDSQPIERCDVCQKEITAGTVAFDISSMYHEKTPERKFMHDLNGVVLVRNPQKNLERDILTFKAIHSAIRHIDDVLFNSTTERTDKLAYQ